MNDYFCLNTTYKISTKINIGNLVKLQSMTKLNKTMKDSNY